MLIVYFAKNDVESELVFVISNCHLHFASRCKFTYDFKKLFALAGVKEAIKIKIT